MDVNRILETKKIIENLTSNNLLQKTDDEIFDLIKECSKTNLPKHEYVRIGIAIGLILSKGDKYEFAQKYQKTLRKLIK